MANSKMITCKVCGNEIAKSAKVCPHCGAKNKQSGSGLLTVVLLFIAIWVGIHNYNTIINRNTNTQPELSKPEYVKQCVSVSYDDVARNPDNYKGKYITFSGEVIQVSEGSTNTYRINQDNKSDPLSSDTWYVTYKPTTGESRILEGDHITVYGVCNGTKSYTSVLGSRITIPSLSMAYHD